MYSEAQMGVQGAPPSPSWYSLQGEPHLWLHAIAIARKDLGLRSEWLSIREMGLRPVWHRIAACLMASEQSSQNMWLGVWLLIVCQLMQGVQIGQK